MFGEKSLHRSASSRFRQTLRLESLEDRTTPASPSPMYSAGAVRGFLPLVNVYLSDNGGVHQFNAYSPVFRGGVRVATADINGDGVSDIITAPGPGGGPDIRVFRRSHRPHHSRVSGLRCQLLRRRLRRRRRHQWRWPSRHHHRRGPAVDRTSKRSVARTGNCSHNFSLTIRRFAAGYPSPPGR